MRALVGIVAETWPTAVAAAADAQPGIKSLPHLHEENKKKKKE